MELRPLGQSGLTIPPLVMGGNVFGWTVDERQSLRLLDALLDHGLTAIDTADVYSAWAPGNRGGESETIIGKWFAAQPSRRDQVTLFTKVGLDMKGPGEKGLSARWIAEGVKRSLARLQTGHIDLYFAHRPDSETPYAETLEAFGALREAGTIRAIGASNLDAAQLGETLRVARDGQLPRYDVLQPEYNLYDRAKFEGDLAELCQRAEIGVVPYYSLASGFLSGKYRSVADTQGKGRAGALAKYFDARGLAILDALAEIADAHSAKSSEVALAWLMAQPAITAPIASATTVEQVESLARACALRLTGDEIATLTRVSTPGPAA